MAPGLRNRRYMGSKRTALSKAKPLKFLRSLEGLAAPVPSKPLTHELQKWEQQGNFREITLQNDGELSLSEKAILYRAQAFFATEQTRSLLRKKIRKLSQENLLDVETKARLFLARSTLCRQESRWGLALNLARRARFFLQNEENSQLIADARFAEAICYVEQGRLFLGLDLFSQIKKQRHISGYRRQ